jgi:hypothetical protein
MQRITSHLLSGLLLILSANILHAQETAFMPIQHQQADSLYQSQAPTSVTEGQEKTGKSSIRKRRHIQRIDREAMKSVFIPKGQWMVGGEISWNEWDNDNLNYLVLKNIEFEGHTFSAGPYFGYFVANNIAVGGRFSYKRFFMNLGQFDLNLGEDLNISLDDLYYLEHNYLSTAFMRSYMPIGRSNVFGFFAEVQLSYGYCEGKNTTGRGETLSGTYEQIHSLQLGFSPGLTVFATDFMASEISVNMGGYRVKWGKQETNKIEEGKVRNSGANFKLNLFSVKFGMTFYL